jgi:hypothetical protein
VVTHRFAIPLPDGFDYIVEPRNWPEYWPRPDPRAAGIAPPSGVERSGDRAGVANPASGLVVGRSRLGCCSASL